VTTLAPNGVAARIVLAILVAAGILYANFGPLIVSGLAHRGFTSANAGYLLSVNLYGTALGGMLIVMKSGVTAIWITLVAFTAVGLALLPWLDRYPPSSSV
jgi:hypothetical protein